MATGREDNDDVRATPYLHQCPQDDDATDGIGDTHQWSVQCGGDIPDHLPTHETGEDKDGEMSHEFIRGNGANTQNGSCSQCVMPSRASHPLFGLGFSS